MRSLSVFSFYALLIFSPVTSLIHLLCPPSDHLLLNTCILSFSEQLSISYFQTMFCLIMCLLCPPLHHFVRCITVVSSHLVRAARLYDVSVKLLRGSVKRMHFQQIRLKNAQSHRLAAADDLSCSRVLLIALLARDERTISCCVSVTFTSSDVPTCNVGGHFFWSTG